MPNPKNKRTYAIVADNLPGENPGENRRQGIKNPNLTPSKKVFGEVLAIFQDLYNHDQDYAESVLKKYPKGTHIIMNMERDD